MPPKEKYTDPKLRNQVKQEIQEGDKGGAPGQWSARKAQMMASEYKKRGGDYNTGKSQQDESQKNLSKWGEEDWQTKEGSGNAKKADGTQKRYLPKKAWEKMTEEEKKETEQKKQEGSKEGKQFVGNTRKAKESREEANEEEDEKFEKRNAEEQEDEVEEDASGGESEDDYDNGESQDGEDDDDDGEDEEEDARPEKSSAGQKRKQQSNGSSSNKKQKSTKEGESGNAQKGKVGSKHMDAAEPGQRGSADRLPKKGASVIWKAMPGYVDGILEEIVTSQKNVNGKSVKASKEDPRLVLKSNSSGKICVHKPDACFYD